MRRRPPATELRARCDEQIQAAAERASAVPEPRPVVAAMPDEWRPAPKPRRINQQPSRHHPDTSAPERPAGGNP